MQRTRRTIPPYIRNLIPSVHKKGQFDITWDRITYTMPLDLAKSLNEYFKTVNEKDVSVAAWLDQLPPGEKALVAITPHE